MASMIDKTVTSKYQPKSTNVIWVDTSLNPPVEKHFVNGKWKSMGGGVSDYSDIKNKPTINGVELDGNKTSQDLGVYSKPSSGIPQSDLSSDVQSQLNKHFKGWFASVGYLDTEYPSPVIGDYAYVKGTESTDPAAIYECTTDGTWSDSGRTADTSNVQTFESGEEVNEVHIVNDLTTGGATDVLSAEQGKQLNLKYNGVESIRFANFLEYGGISSTGRLASSTEGEFYSFFKSIRNGRLIKSKDIQVLCNDSMIEGYSLDENFTLVQKQTSFDGSLVPNMEGAEYFNFVARKLQPLDEAHAKENGYISAQDGMEVSRAGRFRLKGYFPKGTAFVVKTNQNNIRIIVYLYADDYSYIGYAIKETNTENYIFYPGNYGMSNANGAYYRVAFSGYDANSLSQNTIDATEVFTVFEKAPLDIVSVRYKNGKEICQPTITEDIAINCLYETHPHIGSRYSETFVNAEYYTEDKYFNAYILRLPPNYDPNGKPVRLIIWCPGTGAYKSFSQNDFNVYLEYLKYWISEGFAVASFLGNTSRYMNYSNGISDMAIETSVIAYIQGYKYLTSRFNIADDGCFVSAKSLGGLMATQLMFEKNIPVLAVAPLAPKLDAYMISTSMDNDFRGTEIYATDYQWDEGWEQYYDGTNTSSVEKKAYLKSQIRKMLGTQPLLNGIVGKTPEELFEIGYTARGYGIEPLSECYRFCSTPVRIWISVADTTVDFSLSKQFIKSLQNGGSPAELRAFPAPAEGDDAHHMVDNATSAPKVASIVTATGETFTDVPLAYVEVIQYFREHDKEGK